MGVDITKFLGITGDVSPSSKEFPDNAQVDLVNLVPINNELRTRMGSEIMGTEGFTYGDQYHSGCMIDSGTIDFLILHIDSKLIAVSKSYGTFTIGTTYPNLNSNMFRIGKHVFIAFDKLDTDGTAMNYILTVNANGTFSIRKAGLRDFLGGYLSYITPWVQGSGGNFGMGNYKYMFTFATYGSTGMVSEGSGFDEFKFDLTVPITVNNSSISLQFNKGILDVFPSNATHINIFRTLNMDDVWGKDKVYNDSFNITPIYPWFRFLGKISKADINASSPSQGFTYADNTADTSLANVYDTYDTRGWKPVGRMSHGICAPTGRIFWMDKDVSGRLKFTENSISPNRENTKYYEHYPEGQGYWIDLNTAGEQSDRGFAVSPAGDLLVMQDSRIYAIRDFDPLRVNYLGDLKGSAHVVVDSQHGCINNRATVTGPDGRLYIYGKGGYRGFNGNNFDTPDMLRSSNTIVMNPDFVSAGVYYGSLFRDANNETGIDQILFSYPKTVNDNTPNGTLVLVFDKGGVKFTRYENLNASYMFNFPTDSGMVFGDALYGNTPLIFGASRLDKAYEYIGWLIQTKEFMHDKDTRVLFLDLVTLYGEKLHRVKIEPMSDGESVNNSILPPTEEIKGLYSKAASSEFSEVSGVTVGARITGLSDFTTKIKRLLIDINAGEILV